MQSVDIHLGIQSISTNRGMAIYDTIEDVAALATVDVEFSEVTKTHGLYRFEYLVLKRMPHVQTLESAGPMGAP
jgi:hypothetical protein